MCGREGDAAVRRAGRRTGHEEQGPAPTPGTRQKNKQRRQTSRHRVRNIVVGGDVNNRLEETPIAMAGVVAREYRTGQGRSFTGARLCPIRSMVLGHVTQRIPCRKNSYKTKR